jgi:6-methylsalicylate decarboxylase
MKDNNIRKSYLSCSSPGNVLSPAPSDLPAGIALTKRFNNYLSTLKKTHPQQFGFFASLPSPASLMPWQKSTARSTTCTQTASCS